MACDTERLRYMMEEGPDGFLHVTKDRYDYAAEVAAERGREEPNSRDEMDGYRRMLDCAMAGGDRSATTNTPNDLGNRPPREAVPKT